MPPSNGNQIIQSDDGEFWIELDDQGVSLGTWTWDEDEKMWIFDPQVPLGFFTPLGVASLPQTGVSSSFAIFIVVAVSSFAIALSAGLIITRTVLKKKPE